MINLEGALNHVLNSKFLLFSENGFFLNITFRRKKDLIVTFNFIKQFVQIILITDIYKIWYWHNGWFGCGVLLIMNVCVVNVTALYKYLLWWWWLWINFIICVAWFRTVWTINIITTIIKTHFYIRSWLFICTFVVAKICWHFVALAL